MSVPSVNRVPSLFIRGSQVISPVHGDVHGRVACAETLQETQQWEIPTPTVLIVKSISGDDDIPLVRPRRGGGITQDTVSCTMLSILPWVLDARVCK
jgi:hypothetical protein